MSETIDRDRLRAILKEKGRSARDVSRQASLGETAVKDILSGKSKRPEYGTLVAIAAELGCPVTDFTTGGAASSEDPAAPNDPRIVPNFLTVRYKVRAGLWQEIDSETPPDDFAYPAVPHPKFAEWPQWLEKVEGDSANQKVQDGHYIHVVDALEMGYAPKTGDWVVVERTRDQGAIRERSVKQVELLDGIPSPLVRLWPRSTNPRWAEPVDVTTGARPGEEIEVRIVGLVIGSYDPDF